MFAVELVVEPDDEFFAAAEGGGAEVAGGAEEGGGEVGVAGRGCLQVEVDDALPLGDKDLIDAAGELQRLAAAEAKFLRVVLGGDGRSDLRKELLRLGAACSAAAVIVPVDLDGHRNSLLSC